MGSLSIQKGKRAERAIAVLLRQIIEAVCLRFSVPVIELRRNLKQSQIGGFDLDGIDWIAIEIKHHAKPAFSSWWAQTLHQAGTDREPILIYKIHGTQWRVRMWGRLEVEPGRRLRTCVDIDWEAFAIWFEKRLEVEVKKSVVSALGVVPP